MHVIFRSGIFFLLVACGELFGLPLLYSLCVLPLASESPIFLVRRNSCVQLIYGFLHPNAQHAISQIPAKYLPIALLFTNSTINNPSRISSASKSPLFLRQCGPILINIRNADPHTALVWISVNLKLTTISII